MAAAGSEVLERRGDEFYPLPAQWDSKNSKWLPHHVPDGADLVGTVLPKRAAPTGITCDGCHSVNYNIETNQVTE